MSNPTMLKFAPFGVGIHSIEAERVSQALQSVREGAAASVYLAVGLTFLGGLWTMRQGVKVCQVVANKAQKTAYSWADTHDALNVFARESRHGIGLWSRVCRAIHHKL